MVLALRAAGELSLRAMTADQDVMDISVRASALGAIVSPSLRARALTTLCCSPASLPNRATL